ILETYLMDGDGRVVRVTDGGIGSKSTVMAYDGEQLVSAWTEGTSGWSQDWQWERDFSQNKPDAKPYSQSSMIAFSSPDSLSPSRRISISRLRVSSFVPNA